MAASQAVLCGKSLKSVSNKTIVTQRLPILAMLQKLSVTTSEMFKIRPQKQDTGVSSKPESYTPSLVYSQKNRIKSSIPYTTSDKVFRMNMLGYTHLYIFRQKQITK